jgi:multidomain signaling protein FimX
MAKVENVVRLLLVEDSVEDAEQVISVLRNSGLAVRPSRVEDVENLTTVLDDQSFDLVVVSPKSKKLTLALVVAAANKKGKDLPIVQMLDAITQETVLKALREGARDVALRSATDHLQNILKREFENLKFRRNVRKLETALRESERRCNSLLDSSRDPIAYVHEGMHIYANKAYLEMFDLAEFSDIEGTPILDMVAGKDADTFKNILKAIGKGEKPPERINLKAQRSDGSTFDAVAELSEASIEGEPCTQMVFRQQTVNPELAEELENLKRRDLVSGLLNRTTFTAELEKSIASAISGKTDQAFACIDIDSYKRHLDTVGVAGADVLIGDLGAFLKKHIGPNDQAGRLGDHVFGLLLAGRSQENCVADAQKLLKTISDRIFEVNNHSISLTMSAGVFLLTEKSSNLQEVMQRSMDACVAAQKEGGNRTQIYDPSAKDKANEAEHLEWVNQIKTALQGDGFLLMYQPIISLQGEEGQYYEVLLRMKGPSGEIMPATFMPVAERAGLMPHIDRWVISKVVQVLAERVKQGNETTFFVKITPNAIQDGSLLTWLANQIKVARIPGDKLVFEMPESKVNTNLKPAQFFVKGLEQLRCNFALEQFGGGLNSFQMLKHIGANFLKIDRSFMADLPKNTENQAKIRGLCSQARDLGRKTVAEFVEDAASMSILFSCGVDFVQGNFLQEPEKVMSYEF